MGLVKGLADDTLLSYGVPAEWLDRVRGANEDTLVDIAERLPQEAAEALLKLATGGSPEIPVRAPLDAGPVCSPRRAAPFPRADQYRGAGTGARLPLGQMGGFSCIPRSAGCWGEIASRFQFMAPVAHMAAAHRVQHSNFRRTSI